MRDLTAVLDEVGSEQAAIMAQFDASLLALFFAGTRPERTRGLILAHASARYLAADDYPIGLPVEVAEAILAQVDQLWGTQALAEISVPSRAQDERFMRWFQAQRTVASPKAVQSFLRAGYEMDARPILPLIQAPTLILHRRDFPHPHRARTLSRRAHPDSQADRASGSRELADLGDAGLALGHVQEFLTGVRRLPEPTRVLASVLFTDIVSSTQQARRLGDRRWRQVLEVHDERPTGSRSSTVI